MNLFSALTGKWRCPWCGGYTRMRTETEALVCEPCFSDFVADLPAPIMGDFSKVANTTYTVHRTLCPYCDFVTAASNQRPLNCYNCHRALPMLPPLEG